MNVNFSPFEIGRRALRASQLGINVTGHNISNVNTPGYSRQTVDLSAAYTPGVYSNFNGNGVQIDGVRAFRDSLIESRLQTETGINGRLTAQRDVLAAAETSFDSSNGGSSIQTALEDFFNSFRDLEANPTSLPVREAIVGKGKTLASAFNTTRARLDSLRHEADQNLRATVNDVNDLTQKIASLNSQIQNADKIGTDVSALRDERSEAMKSLAELTGARAIENQDGTLTVTIGDGSALVTGDKSFTVSTVDTPPDGFAALTLNGQAANFSDGKLRGLIDAINDVGGQIGSLDDLAASIVSRVNQLHTSGVDMDGNNGVAFFDVPANGASVTAANIKVSDAVQANARLVVASAAGAGSGDSTIAHNIAGLLSDTSSQVGARTGSYDSIFASMIADAGAKVKSVNDELTTQQAILSQTTAQRDSISGVSLDEEAINMLQYQRAYEAAAKFLKVADEMTQTILSLGQ
jgi:flagellar hook-associated protein 1 FlgK